MGSDDRGAVDAVLVELRAQLAPDFEDFGGAHCTGRRYCSPGAARARPTKHLLSKRPAAF